MTAPALRDSDPPVPVAPACAPVEADEVVDDDLLDGELVCYRADVDPEAQILCALLWSGPGTVAAVAAHLRGEDFYRPMHAEIYTVITALHAEGRAHTPPLVFAELAGHGRLTDTLKRALLAITTAGTREHDARPLALAVLAQAYRRGYATAAIRLAQIAEQAHTGDLYELLCRIGRERRDAHTRLTTAEHDLR